jgi:hypothetical protein
MSRKLRHNNSLLIDQAELFPRIDRDLYRLFHCDAFEWLEAAKSCSIEAVVTEKRGEIMRLVQTLRGGDRPKNAERGFEMVSVMPRSCWEPWGLFRKPCEGRVQDNLRKWRTGGLRRISNEEPFKDVIESSVARNGERAIAPHPSLKPQHFMRQIVRASLPFGEGTILDPFMGSGSTIAAATACGLRSIGLESNDEYFDMAARAIPLLAASTRPYPKGLD